MTDQNIADQKTASGETFADLGVDDELVAALAEDRITEPFAIQQMTIPLALSGADIIGQARTGTGKTLAFGLPLLQRIRIGSGHVEALVITPTRELAVQVSEDIDRAGRRVGVRVLTVYGGTPMEPQIEALRKGEVDVVVGTPGRLLDHLRRRNLVLDDVHVLVLDEADRMLDMGFLPDVEQLMEACGEDRQTSLFSATMPSEIVALGRRFMRSPTFIRAESEEPQVAPDTEQYFLVTHRLDKPRVLARILQSPKVELATVFVSTKRMADRLVDELRSLGVNATPIHGDLRQAKRERNLERFREGKSEVLVATEVAARGLDIERVTHVINYDCPDDEKMYLHRIGRTGRAGAAGVAVTFAQHDEIEKMNVIRKRVDATDSPVHEVFSTSEVLTDLFDLPERTPWDRFGTEDDEGQRGDRGADRSGGDRAGGRSGAKGSGGKRSGGRPGGNGSRGERSGGGQRSRGKRSGEDRPEGQRARRQPSDNGDRERAGRDRDRRRERAEATSDDTAQRVRVRRREDPTTDGSEATRADDAGSARSRRRSRGAGADRSGGGDAEQRGGGSRGGRGANGAAKDQRRGEGSRARQRSGGSGRSGQQREQRPAATAEQAMTEPGDEARGGGRPTLSRRVQVEHIP